MDHRLDVDGVEDPGQPCGAARWRPPCRGCRRARGTGARRHAAHRLPPVLARHVLARRGVDDLPLAAIGLAQEPVAAAGHVRGLASRACGGSRTARARAGRRPAQPGPRSRAPPRGGSRRTGTSAAMSARSAKAGVEAGLRRPGDAQGTGSRACRSGARRRAGGRARDAWSCGGHGQSSSRTAAVRRRSSPSSALTRVDLPTPDEPRTTAVRPGGQVVVGKPVDAVARERGDEPDLDPRRHGSRRRSGGRRGRRRRRPC